MNRLMSEAPGPAEVADFVREHLGQCTDEQLADAVRDAIVAPSMWADEAKAATRAADALEKVADTLSADSALAGLLRVQASRHRTFATLRGVPLHDQGQEA